MKRTAKPISILVALAIFLGTWLPLGSPALADTDNAVKKPLPTVPVDFEGLLNTLTITEDGDNNDDFQQGKTFILTLPTNVKFAANDGVNWNPVSSGTDALKAYNDPSTQGTSVTAWVYGSQTDVVESAVFSNDRTLTVTFGSGNTGDQHHVKINFYVILDGAAGDIKVNIDPFDSNVSGDDVTLAKSVEVGLSGVVLNTESTADQNNTKLGVIRLTESNAGAIRNGDVITLRLKSGFTWSSGTRVSALAGLRDTNLIENNSADTDVFNFAGSDVNGGIVSDNKKELKIKIDGLGSEGTTTRGIIDIAPRVDIDSDAVPGNIEVYLSGDHTNAATLVVGQYAGYGVSVTAKDAPERLSGSYEAEMGTIIVEENVSATMPGGRKLTVELPDGAKFQSMPEIHILSGRNIFTGSPAVMTAVDDKRQKATLTVDSNRNGFQGKLKFEIRLKKINLRADVSGDLEVKVAGSALGEEKKVVLGKITAPVTVTTETKELKLGMSEQRAGDIIIKETVAGAIKDKGFAAYTGQVADPAPNVAQGSITFTLPGSRGVKFSKTPKVEVVEGDLQLGKITLTDKVVTVDIKMVSSKPSAVKVSEIMLDVDRTVPQGDIQVDVGGTSLIQTHQGSNAAKGFDHREAAKIYPARVITAAPGFGSAVFHIGSTVYNVHGAVKVMDAAPYVKQGRTYVPVRYLSLAMGVDEKDILFENGVVSLKKGDALIKLTIGNKSLDINGNTTVMDVAPEVVKGRTMLPARFVAEGLGARVGFGNNQVVISY